MTNPTYFTSEEQSRKLIKAGLNVNSADMWAARNTSNDPSFKWHTPHFIPLLEQQATMDERDKFFVVNKRNLFKTVLPVWSLVALIDIIRESMCVSTLMMIFPSSAQVKDAG